MNLEDREITYLGFSIGPKTSSKQAAKSNCSASDNYKLILQAHIVSNGVTKTMTLRNAAIDTTDHGAWRRRHGQKVIL